MPRILCDSCHGLGCWTCAGEGFTGKDDPPVVKSYSLDSYTTHWVPVAPPQQTQKYIPKGSVSGGGGIRGSGGPSVGGGTPSGGPPVASVAIQRMACAACDSRMGWSHKYSQPLPNGGGMEHTFACIACGYHMFYRVPPPVPLVAP